MKLGELNIIEQTTSLYNVGETTEGVIKVLEGWPEKVRIVNYTF